MCTSPVSPHTVETATYTVISVYTHTRETHTHIVSTHPQGFSPTYVYKCLLLFSNIISYMCFKSNQHFVENRSNLSFHVTTRFSHKLDQQTDCCLLCQCTATYTCSGWWLSQRPGSSVLDEYVGISVNPCPPFRLILISRNNYS